jgi:hypothetical protein
MTDGSSTPSTSKTGLTSVHRYRRAEGAMQHHGVTLLDLREAGQTPQLARLGNPPRPCDDRIAIWTSRELREPDGSEARRALQST